MHHLVVAGDLGRAAHHDPVLGAVVVLLQRQLLARQHHDPLHPEALAEVHGLVPAPGPVHPRRGRRLGEPPRLELGDESPSPPAPARSARPAPRRGCRRPRARRRRARRGAGRRSGDSCWSRRGHARGPRARRRASSCGLCSQTAFQSPMSDQAKSAATTAARLVRSITAWSKLIFGARQEGAAEPQRPEVVLRRRRGARCTASSARGACSLDLAQAGVRPEAEHARRSRGSPRRSAPPPPRVGLLDEPRRPRARRRLQRLAGRDVAVGRRRRRSA